MRHGVNFVSHDVRENPLDKEDTLCILQDKFEFFEKKPKKVRRLHRNDDILTEEVLAKIFLGRSGTLRAPVLSGEKWIMAGFDEETYRELLDLKD